MNIFFWVLQVMLALHTIMGAFWKFSHSPARTMPSLAAIPSGVWLAMSIVELLCAVGLVLPIGYVAPISALVIAIEMVSITGVHLLAGSSSYGPVVYWLVVAVVCAIIAYGRLALKPF